MTHPPTHETLFSHFTNSLPDDIRRVVLDHAVVRDYRAGEMIYAQDTPADALYFVVSGAVCLCDSETSAQTRIVAGESFGESELLRGARYAHTALAICNARLGVLEKRVLDALLEKHSALSLALARQVAQKIEERRWALPIAPRSSHPTRHIALIVMLALFLVGIGLTAASLMFFATTINVAGLALESGNEDADTAAIEPSPNPTKVAIAVATNTPAPTVLPKPETSSHIVVAGDSLSSIAWMHGTTLATVRALNNLESDVIRAGNQLTVPGGAVTRVAVALPTRTPRPLPTVAPTQFIAPSTPQPRTVAPAALAMPVAPTPLPREWKMPAWTSVEDANVPAGQKYFRLVKAFFFDEASAGGRVNILVGVLDENGKELADIPVRMEWGVNEYTTRKTEDKRDPFLIPYNLNIIAAHDMAGGSSFAPDRGERGGYKIMVEGFPSDIVSGMGLPLKRHVAFVLVFQRTTR